MDVIDRLSQQDAEEEERKGRVAEKNALIFGAIVHALRERIARYNERQRTDRFVSKAVLVSDGPNSSLECRMLIKKTTIPISELRLNFPFNDGVMKIAVQTVAGSATTVITVDIDNDDAPFFNVGHELHSVDTFVDLLLDPVLSSTGTATQSVRNLRSGGGKKFGFV